MLKVYRSNRMERLADALATTVATPLPSPLEKEWIGVTSRGMRTWLARELASRFGIFAGATFPFPRKIVERILQAKGADLDNIRAFHEERLVWSILELLPGMLGRPQFREIAMYLAGDPGETFSFQLSKKIAHLFDEYCLYRPDMVLAWEAGEGDHWQAMLWQALIERNGNGHLARTTRDLLAAGEWRTWREPPFKRLALFGVTLLPPLYLKLLAALPADFPVHLFVLSPSEEWWADIRKTPRTDTGDDPLGEQGEGSLDEAHPLLDGLGRVARDFQWLLEEIAVYEEPLGDLYLDPAPVGAASRLARLQSDILHLTHGVSRESDEDDPSIRIVGCHSPLRELEVLKNHLLDLFDDPARAISPDDVMVLAPDITTYLPYIEAVFGGGAVEIPFTIAGADLPPSAAASALMQLLSLPEGRFTVQEVFDLLLLEPVRARFDLSESEVLEARRWIAGAGVRWGRNKAHRESLGHPGFHENTWRFGLQRLLLGVALSPDEGTLFRGVSPYGSPDNSDGVLLGKLARFFDSLTSALDRFEGRHVLSEWERRIKDAFDLLTTSAPNERSRLIRRRVRSLISSAASHAEQAGFRGSIPYPVVKRLLSDLMAESGGRGGWRPFGVTFSTLLMMRSIPAKVVAVLGMNDHEFPRNRGVPGFDLMAEKPRIGDRSMANDDRLQFLEAILAARHTLIVSFVGQSIRSGEPRPPSVVVSELLDCLSLSSGDGIPSGEILVRHPLQPFSRRYFQAPEDPRLFSYDPAGFRGAMATAAPRTATQIFFDAPLPPGDEAPEEIALGDLVAFFSSPARFLMKRRLGAVFPQETEALSDKEPLTFADPETRTICQRLLDMDIEGEPVTELLPRLRASGLLPLGNVAPARLRQLQELVAPLLHAARPYTRANRLTPLEIHQSLGADGSLRLTGRIDRIWDSARLEHAYLPPSGRWIVQTWVQHLALLIQAAEGYPKTSVIVGRGRSGRPETVTFPEPKEDPATLMSDLIEIYRMGLDTPIPFFPRHAYEYVARLRQGKQPLDKVYEAVRREWEQGLEPALPMVETVYRGTDPFDRAHPFPLGFEELAERVFGPILRCMEGGSV